MGNPVSTTCDDNGVVLGEAAYNDELFTPGSYDGVGNFVPLSGSKTYRAGLLLAHEPAVSGGAGPKFRVYTPVATDATSANSAVAILTYDVAASGSSDVKVRLLRAGRVNKNKLLTDSGAAIETMQGFESLRDAGVEVVDVAATSS